MSVLSNHFGQILINYWWIILRTFCRATVGIFNNTHLRLFHCHLLLVTWCRTFINFWGKSNWKETMFLRSSVLGNWRLSACKFETTTTPVLLSAFFSKLLEGLQWVKRQLAPKRKFHCSRRSPVDLWNSCSILSKSCAVVRNVIDFSMLLWNFEN